ncbi:MAG: hypothetical protein VX346_26210 [Planctomycetota bacterium]|nr:hypothetical protein [Planctomycetota bacterium]
MDARLLKLTSCATFILLMGTATGRGASYRTQNFLVTGNGDKLAREVAIAAERHRRQLALDWLGHELPPWHSICPIRVTAQPQLAAGGATSFGFHRGRPLGWSMQIQGSRERILDSVLPHEILHTVFATHFGQPLPRWADEGACTTVEHQSEQAKQRDLLTRFLTTRPSRGIAFNQMFPMREYPRDILPLYAQGYSVTQFLLARGGKRKFVQFVESGLQRRDWEAALSHYYGFSDLSDLQVSWNRELQTQLNQLLEPNTEYQPTAATASTRNTAHGATVETAQPAPITPITETTIPPGKSIAQATWQTIPAKQVASLETMIASNIALTQSTVQSAKQKINRSMRSVRSDRSAVELATNGSDRSRTSMVASRTPPLPVVTGWYARRAAAARRQQQQDSNPRWQPIRISGTPAWY